MNANFLRSFDNMHLDIGRVLWVVGALAYIGITVFAIWHGQQQIDWTAWAMGYAVVHGVGAGGAGLKDFWIAKAFAVKQATLVAKGEPG